MLNKNAQDIKVQGQSEATLQTGSCDQKSLISAEAKKLIYQKYCTFNSLKTHNSL